MTLGRSLGAATAFSLSFGAAACDASGDAPGASVHTVRDSAGVTIVESHEPAWDEGEAWILRPRPELEIGEAMGDPRQQLSRVTGLAGLSTGGVVLALGSGAAELRWYDESGRFVRSAGAPGEGPVEFGYPSSLTVAQGDTVRVWDVRLRRFSTFSPSGEYVSGHRLETDPTRWPSVFRIRADGAAFLTANQSGDDGYETGVTFRDPEVVIFDPDPSVAGGDEVAIGPFPGPEYVMIESPGGDYGRPAMFGQATALAAGDSVMHVGDTGAWEIRRYDLGGNLTHLVRRAGGARPVTPAVVDSARDAMLARYDDASIRRRIRREWATMEVPDSLPVFAGLQLDEDGNLWAREFDFLYPSVRSTWSVFDPSGAWLGRVEMPTGFRVREITSDTVLGVYFDELNVEYVRRYGIRKP